MKTVLISPSSLFLTGLTVLVLSGCATSQNTAETLAEPETIIAEDLSAPINLNDEEAVQSALADSGDAKTVTSFGADGQVTQQNANETPAIPLGDACPKVQILSDAQSITYFDEEASAATPAMIARASISDIRGGCELTAEGLEVDLDMMMSGVITSRGRFQGRNDLEAFMTFPYFIAVFDEMGRPYSKQILATAMRFDPLQDRTDHAEKITQTIPIANQSNMGQFTITVGFQLNRKQLAYNKAQGLDKLHDTAPATDDVSTGISEDSGQSEAEQTVSGQMAPILE